MGHPDLVLAFTTVLPSHLKKEKKFLNSIKLAKRKLSDKQHVVLDSSPLRRGGFERSHPYSTLNYRGAGIIVLPEV